MAAALRQLGDGGAARRPWLQPLRLVPGVTLFLFLAPIAAGLIGTFLPAFGWLPELGGERFGLHPWRVLFAAPGLAGAVRLTLVSGLLATVLSLLLVVGYCAACHDTALFARLRRFLAPLLAVPHAATAIGLAFLIAPSGWILRLLSPWATGWDTPPDIATVQDAYGLALVGGLVLKETPYLLLMTLGALDQVHADRSLAVARALGYAPAAAWLKTVLPRIYPQIRLPVYAVLAFSLSVVDMALILGPGMPPPFAPMVLRWFYDPDLAMRFQAAAGAVLQLGLVAAAIGSWYGLELLVARLARPWLAGGGRGAGGRLGRAVAGTAMATVFATAGLGLVALALWSVARRWPYPDALPAAWTLDNWARHLGALAWPTWTTLTVGLAAAGAALVLALGCLENEQRHGVRLSARGLWLLYTPLLVPQVSFLFGAQALTAGLGIGGTWPALVWSHLLFVLPYLFLSLADPYRALDDRYARAALCLGASPARVFWRVKLPMLLRPALFALAIGFAVSVSQYLPTLFAGSGRYVTLTTEAVTLAAGADRRVIAVYALLQALLPLLAFAGALAVPGWLYRRRYALAGIR
ncbi:MAG: ABC transporter permease subunit [Dongiaceae bacterium]